MVSLLDQEPSVKLNVLLYEDNGEWVAHCLQMDIVTTGESMDKVQKDMIDLIRAQVLYALENENLSNIFKPAPEAEWKMLSHTKRCGSLKITVESAPQGKTRGNALSPIREVELCVA